MKTLKTASEGVCEWDGVWVNIVTLSKQVLGRPSGAQLLTPLWVRISNDKLSGSKPSDCYKKSITHILNLIHLTTSLISSATSAISFKPKSFSWCLRTVNSEHYHNNSMCSRGDSDIDLDVNNDTGAAQLAKSTKLLRYIGWGKAIHSHWTQHIWNWYCCTILIVTTNPKCN